MEILPWSTRSAPIRPAEEARPIPTCSRQIIRVSVHRLQARSVCGRRPIPQVISKISSSSPNVRRKHATLMFGPQAAFVTEQFPTRVRYAGSSLAYTLAGIIGGGFAPLIMASLLQAYRTTIGISLYVEGALCVTLVALLLAREAAKSPLEE